MQADLARGEQLRTLSDEEIVDRVLGGERSLFEILMRRHNRRLFRVACAILGGETEAEDVMQETYARAYEHLDQFARRARFSTWLTKIAVHEASARVRRQARFRTTIAMSMAHGQEPVYPASTRDDPEQLLFASEVKDLLERAVGDLPADYRAVFVLRKVEEMDTAETADVLSISEEVVRTRLLRARGMLRDDLFEKAGATTSAAFSFHLSRCDRVVASVMGLIAPASGGADFRPANG